MNKHHKSKKDKKSKGHQEANLTVTPKEFIENDLQPVFFWDDWSDHRDGQREFGDRSRIRPTKGIYDWYITNMHIYSDNKKLKKKEQIRRLQKNKVKLL